MIFVLLGHGAVVIFSELYKYCNIIATCTWSGCRGRNQKLTEHTGKERLLYPRSQILKAATFSMTEKGFDYVLLAVFAEISILMLLTY